MSDRTTHLSQSSNIHLELKIKMQLHNLDRGTRGLRDKILPKDLIHAIEIMHDVREVDLHKSNEIAVSQSPPESIREKGMHHREGLVGFHVLSP